MKTIVKQLATATIITLLLIVMNVKAEGSEKRCSKFRNMETTLQLENWMTDETIWNVNSVNIEEFVQETETGLELEDWMINETTWNTKDIKNESGLQIDSLRTAENIW